MSKLVLVKDEPVSLTRKPIELNLPEYGIYIGESRHERGFEMDPMRNDYTKVYYILEGAADCITQDKTIKLSPENLLVIPTGMEHYLKDNENSLYHFIFSQSSTTAWTTWTLFKSKSSFWMNSAQSTSSH